MDSFHSEIQGPVFLSVEPDAKLDMLKTFDLNKPFDLYLDPPSSENLPLCRITQDGKDPIITIDFYLTNVEQREWILPTPPTNNEVATSNTAAAVRNHHQKYQLIHSNQVKFDYTPDSCILLRLQFWISEVRRLLQHWIWSMLFTSYIYVPWTVINKRNHQQMAEGKDVKPTNPNNQLSDSDTLDDEPNNPKLKTSVEERHGTIPGSALATHRHKQTLLWREDPSVQKESKSCQRTSC